VKFGGGAQERIAAAAVAGEHQDRWFSRLAGNAPRGEALAAGAGEGAIFKWESEFGGRPRVRHAANARAEGDQTRFVEAGADFAQPGAADVGRRVVGDGPGVEKREGIEGDEQDDAEREQSLARSVPAAFR